MNQSIYQVSDINRLVKENIESNFLFRDVTIEGEVSNFVHHSSGHMYFTLKDTKSTLRCVFFRGKNMRLLFRPENGMTILARGSLTVYEAAGQYQLNVDELHPEGVGALHIAFEQLKNKLSQEGLFSPERKRPIPFLPRSVGVITSPTGAAIRDILSVLERRYPGVNVIIVPAVVQGEAGPDSVVDALRVMNERDDVDVVIVGRGGGSLEELWTFNDERVARAIAGSRAPVISAVGHETDVTIADFVADKRAPTPSAAAELAVPERDSLQRELAARLSRLQVAALQHVKKRRDRLELLTRSRVISRPLDQFDQKRQQIDELSRRMESVVLQRFRLERERFEAAVAQLNSLSPLATLSRGYAVCTLDDNGQTVIDASRVDAGARVSVTVKRGVLRCVVEGKVVEESER